MICTRLHSHPNGRCPDNPDPLVPKYCSKCGRILEEKLLEDGYDIYTGEKKYKNFLVCRTLNSYHDVWEEEETLRQTSTYGQHKETTWERKYV